jgi:hypothetical protein
VPYAGPAYEAYELAQLAMREPTDEEIEAEVRQIEEESL